PVSVIVPSDALVLSAYSDLSFASFDGARDHRDLHSFPPRRSSDLTHVILPVQVADLEVALADILGRSGSPPGRPPGPPPGPAQRDRKSTRLNSSHVSISYAVFCLKKKKYTLSNRRENCRSYRRNRR